MTAAKKAAAKTAASSDAADEAPKFEASGYIVTAPLISVVVGEQVLQFRSGDVLPKGIDDDSVERLTDRGFIEKQ